MPALDLMWADLLPVRCDQHVAGRLVISAPTSEVTFSGSLPRRPIRVLRD